MDYEATRKYAGVLLAAVYPERAGFTEETTSKLAADAIEESGKATRLRDEVVRTLGVCRSQHELMMPWDFAPPVDPGMTADEISAELGESVLSIRPRCTELLQRGVIERTGERRRSSTGRMQHVLRLK